MTVNDIVESIKTLFNFKVVEETEDTVVFNVISDKTALLNKKYLTDLIQELKGYSSDQQIELFSTSCYEVLVRNEARIMSSREIAQQDNVNKINYKIDKPSDQYLIFFLYNLGQQNTPNILRRGIMPHRLRRMFENGRSDQQELFQADILGLIKEIIPRLETLQIRSDNSKRKVEFEQLLYAFIFNLGYNLDYTVMPLRFMDEFTQPYRLGRMRRSSIGEIEPPKRLYSNELILHYQKGVSSESIDHQFLSFYHVLEHFFEKIYNDDIINGIKNEITKPDFSYKRNRDIASLVSLIQHRLRYKNEEFLINELEALELTLRKFIPDTTILKNELETISPELVQYYKNTEVPFSKGMRVNFESQNHDEIFKHLSKRIYTTRNAIVHSKETEKLKYTPFKDDKDLLTEIYLMRLVAELIIIGDSKEH